MMEKNLAENLNRIVMVLAIHFTKFWLKTDHFGFFLINQKLG